MHLQALDAPLPPSLRVEPSTGEFLWNARGANEALSLVSFQDKFLDDFDKFAQQQVFDQLDLRFGFDHFFLL